MARPSTGANDRILDTATRLLRLDGAGALTMDRVANEAGCAKGLVTYHFKTKGDLLAAAANGLFAEREHLWKSALSAPTPEAAISRSWRLICDEVDQGFWRALSSLGAETDKVTVRTVNNRQEEFCRTLALSVRDLLAGLALEPTVPGEELGHLVAAALQGFEIQLASGIARPHVESGHAALWVAILSLTRPRS